MKQSGPEELLSIYASWLNFWFSGGYFTPFAWDELRGLRNLINQAVMPKMQQLEKAMNHHGLL